MQDTGLDAYLIGLDQEKAFDRILHTDILMSICNHFELASGAKVDPGKSEAMLFENWVNRSFIPFADYLEVLGIRFGDAEVCTKAWEERIANVRQKLGFWEHHSLSIVATMDPSYLYQ
eukprot:g32829.t1